MTCPNCDEPVRVDVVVALRLTWRDALKLRLAGPELRGDLLDTIRLGITEAAMNRNHPEND
jgi:hypothetical protein